MRLRTAALIVIAHSCLLLSADDDDRQQQLQRVNQNISQVSQKIQSDTREISSIRNDINDLSSKITRIDTRLQKLKSQEKDLSLKLAEHRNESDHLLQELEQQEKQMGLIFNAIYRQSFKKAASLIPIQNTDDYLSRYYLKRLQESYAQQYEYYRILSGRKQKSEQQVQQQSTRLEENQRELLHEQANLEKLRKQRHQLNQQLKNQVSANERKLIALKQEKRSLEQLLSDIESRSARRPADTRFSNLRGRLIAPVSPARLQASFGDQRGGGIVWDGLLLNTAPNTDIVAIASGIIAFSGPLKTMGNYVVIDHGDGYFSFYSAAVLLVEKGSTIESGQRIASTGPVANAVSQVYFGLRHNGQALNPADWIVRSW